MSVDPANHGNADGIREPEQQLIPRLRQREVGRALEAGVFPRRHPSHSQLPLAHRLHDLLSASAPRGLKAVSQRIEARFSPLAIPPHATENGSDVVTSTPRKSTCR